jgi:alanine-glyoxylate transaminase/serine-glyoxylate transaminase/serine-pyruvate transaminase
VCHAWPIVLANTGADECARADPPGDGPRGDRPSRARVRGADEVDLAAAAKSFGTRDGAVILYPTSGTGAWEASLVNVLAPGERILAFNYGHFSALFAQTARNLGYAVDEVPLRWGQALAPETVEARLRADGGERPYAAILVVHNETSTGVMSDVAAIRAAIDRVGHDALLIVDTVSSLASVPFAFDEWGVDVALTGSQKGLMLPPGLGIVCAARAPWRGPTRAARRATSSTGDRSCATTPTASSPTPRRPSSSSACARR